MKQGQDITPCGGEVVERSYKVVIIGSGPAGQRAAIQCAKKNVSTLVIDRRSYKLGGVSLHSGTIPSKTLREAVLYLRGIRRKKIYGPSKRFKEIIKLGDLMERVETILSYEMRVLESQFKGGGVDTLYGQASFIDPHTLRVEDRDDNHIATIKAEKIIIATGTIPRHPDDVPFDYETILDSNFIFSSKSKLDKLPKTLIVYGAGVIGSEYAAMFAALGCNVHLVDSHSSMFPFMDRDIVGFLENHMKQLNMSFSMGKEYKKIDIAPSGKARLETTDGCVFEGDALLFSKGRIPCVEPLNSQAAGFEIGRRGLINVNERYQTNVDHIYACGDVIGFPALASTSSEQGRIAARYALDLEVKDHHPDLFPLAIYTIPEISAIGKTEQDLEKENISYIKCQAYYKEVAKAAIVGDDTGMLKILFHPETREIQGVHIIGDQAAEIIHLGQLALTVKEKIDFFIKNVFNYPSWAEAYKVAALRGFNKIER